VSKPLRPDFEFEVQPLGVLRFADASRVVEHIQAGDLCLLPSDSSYILTGLATERGVTDDLDRILEREHLAMSLTFGSMRLARRWANMSVMAASFVGQLTPGGLTFVAAPTSAAVAGLATSRLHASGTIGMRLTESHVETQLAYEIEQPLPSTPVRRADGSETATAEEALAIVAARMSQLPIKRRLGVVVGTVPYPGRLSTVAQEVRAGGLSRIRVLREGAIPIETIRTVARACRYEDVDIDPM
jgi:tRNA A37 threonylcarbamoyladenosine synthetase subunit TsaC/SUA5/YrdC